MLRTENISYGIGKKSILRKISAEFHPGEFNMILGPNGSGKSTFLKIFSGEIKANKGDIFYAGKHIRTIKTDELAKYRAVMSQQPELSFPLTVEEVVMMGRYPHFAFNPGKKDEKICNEVMDRMNLQSFKERNYLTLSGGEKQRVQFARVLAQIWEKPVAGTRYLFLDEPLASLDINYQQEFLQITREFTDADTVVAVVIHDINLAVQFADKLLLLQEGSIAAQGKPLDILTETLIEKVFGVKTTILKNPVSGAPLVIFDR
ncbi:MAG TPA: heme ABC transporter ATP-binding protein [Chitinophagaceae bacterium]|jgi:iron complex transport system ATP-binding protein|nr:heme ABC transporter ATP-binding protein [Chitinophagaceae bacterium]